MISCLLSIILSVIPAQGSAFLTQLQERDSVLIADQLVYGFELRGVEEGTPLFLPQFKKEGDEDSGIMMLTDWQLDTVKVYKAKKGGKASYDIRAGIVLTSFDEGEYELPQLAVVRGNPDGGADTLVFDPVPALKITTIPIDTDTYELHDIKGQIRYPLTFKELLPYILGLIGLGAIIYLIVWLVRRRKTEDEMAHKEPAHIVALRKLDGYRGDKFWQPEKQKIFYSGVTDTLREYIVARYGVSAMEMTTQEIFDDLKGSDIPADLYNELEDLFQRADFVKFAKHVASREENAGVLPLAVRFVTTTYQSEVDDEASADGAAADGTAAEGAATEEVATEGENVEDHSRWLPKADPAETAVNPEPNPTETEKETGNAGDKEN